jgi:hypothetical protein
VQLTLPAPQTISALSLANLVFDPLVEQFRESENLISFAIENATNDLNS